MQLIARAKTSILLIDNWVGVGTLDMLAKKCFAFTKLDGAEIPGLQSRI